MSRFEVLILGNSSALPAYGRHPSGQVVNIHEHYLMIDCGEGTQDRMSQYHVKGHRIDHIFISHLHGDHYFGLQGLITSMNLTGRKHALHIYSPPGLKSLIDLVIRLADSTLNFEIYWIDLLGDQPRILLEDTVKQVIAFPLNHRIDTYGFLIRENPGQRIFRSELFKVNPLPYEAIKMLKAGHDVLLENGQFLEVDHYTLPPANPRSYAYCSDTLFEPKILMHILESDLVYHEATYTGAHQEKAKENYHSTAKEAAEIALKANAKKLIIGHFSSRYKQLDLLLEEAKSVFEATEIAQEGKWFQV